MHSVDENETVTKDISVQVTREMFHEAPHLQYLGFNDAGNDFVESKMAL